MAGKTVTISDYLLQRLNELGAEHMFCVPGDYTLDFLDRVCTSKVKYVGCCNELNAGYAADGYARMRGIGAVSVTYGVGGMSVMNAVAGAYAEDVPLVAISGAPNSTQRTAHATVHHLIGDYSVQFDMFRHVTVDSILLNNPRTAPAQIDRALSNCVTHRKPVYIELPTDIVGQRCHAPSARKFEQKHTSDPAPLAECVAEAADILNTATNPIMMLGCQLYRFGLADMALDIIERIEIPFATTIDGKSALPENHPQFMGVYMGGMSREIVREQLEESDGLLCLGTLLTDINTGAYSAKLPEDRMIMAMADGVTIKHHVYKNVWLGDFLKALLKTLMPRDFVSSHPRAPHTPAGPFKPVKGRKLEVARFYECLNCFLDREDMVLMTGVCDALFGACEVQVNEAADFVSQAYYLSIGYSTPSALGVCLANPAKRVVLIEGDGSFQMTCQEVSTMIRQKCNPIIFILNNDGYVIEEMIHKGPYNRIQRWEYDKLPAVFGKNALSMKVSTEDELERAMRRARKATNKLVFVNLLLPWGKACAALDRLGAQLRRLQADDAAKS